ncbi:MAG: FAD-dependent oxidoreductase [Haloferacaceae archaeon]
MRVAIVGGGIVGLYTSYFLADQGAEVVLFEKSTPGSGSTGKSGGGISSQFSRPTKVKLSQVSRTYWDEFESEFDAYIERRRVGHLLLARERETATRLEADVEMQNRNGVPSELLDPEEAAELCPGLRTEEFVGAAYSPRDEFVDPDLVTMALERDLEERDVDIRRQTKVTDVISDGDAVVGVRTRDGETDADAVVNAAGPWAGQVASMADVRIPIKPELHRMALVRPDAPFRENVPLTKDLDGGSVFRPRRGETVAIGGREQSPRCDPDSFPPSATVEWTQEMLEGVASISRRFGPETDVKNTISGHYATTPDGLPVLEETLPGFVNAIGFSGHGFMHAPAAGRLVTELLCEGGATSMDVTTLGSDRFDDEQTEIERNAI